MLFMKRWITEVSLVMKRVSGNSEKFNAVHYHNRAPAACEYMYKEDVNFVNDQTEGLWTYAQASNQDNWQWVQVIRVGTTVISIVKGTSIIMGNIIVITAIT